MEINYRLNLKKYIFFIMSVDSLLTFLLLKIKKIKFFSKQLILLFPKLFQDSVAEVRDCALAFLGKYQSIVDHDDFSKAISNLNEAKKSKLLEAKKKDGFEE